MKRWYPWIGVAIGLGLASSLASAATWPLWRGSKERTAMVRGQFAQGAPQVSFRMPLGGDTTRSAMFPPDLPGTLLSAVGGRVRALDLVTGGVQWQSPMLQELTLAGSADLDGDGRAEVVAFTRRQAFAFSSEDGRVLWKSVMGEHSTVSAVRVADVTGDGLAEVLIDDCATCGVPGPLMGEVVSFAPSDGPRDGDELQARTLWTIQANAVPNHYHQGTDAVLRGLGDGRPLLGLTTVDDYRLVDGLTGNAMVVVPRGEHWFAQCASMVAAPDQVLLLRAVGNAKGLLPPVVLSLHVSPELGHGNVAWEYAGDLYATLDLSEASVADLDNDGAVEVVVNELGADGSWSMVFLDVTSGAVSLRVPHRKLEGVVPTVRIADAAALIVSDASGLGLATYHDGALTPIGEPLTGWEPTSAPAANATLVGPIRSALAQYESDQGTALLVGKTATSTSSRAGFATVGWANITASGLHVTTTHTPAHAITAVYAANGATRPYAQFALGTTDGAVTVLDRHLRPSNGSLYRAGGWFWENNRQTEYVGVSVGGRQPGRANLISSADEQPFVVIPNTAAGTVAADVRAASLVGAPEPLWTAEALLKPSVFETAAGTFVAGVDDQDLTLRNAQEGNVVARIALNASELEPLGSPHDEPLLLTYGEHNQVVSLDVALPANQIAQRGFAWTAEGLSRAWSSEPLSWGGGFFSSGGRYQFDANPPNTDVLVMATNGATFYRRADTGAAVNQTVYTGHYTLPIFADFNGDATTDILFQSGFVSPYLYGPNWAPLWQKPGPLSTYTMAGALVPCATGARYATPYLRSPRLLVHDGQTGKVVRDAVAAGGALFDTEPLAQAAGAAPGFLSNMSVLASDQGDALILFGSTDGYLYAVNGCDGVSLGWALDVGAPLGEPSIGDWDGDGDEELLVGAGTGHVLGIDFGRLAAPNVRVAHVSHHSARVSWDPVDGALGYEYALVSPDGRPVWKPPYRRTRATHARIGLERTLAGRPFRVAVRARTSSENGNDGFSSALSLTDSRAPRVHAGVDARHGLWLGAADASQLDHYLIWQVDAVGKRTLLEDGFLRGRFAHATAQLPAARTSRAVAFVVTVVDAAGHRAEVEVARPRPAKLHHEKHHHGVPHPGHAKLHHGHAGVPHPDHAKLTHHDPPSSHGRR